MMTLCSMHDNYNVHDDDLLFALKISFTTCETDLFMLNVYFIIINKWGFFLIKSSILSWSNCSLVEKIKR